MDSCTGTGWKTSRAHSNWGHSWLYPRNASLQPEGPCCLGYFIGPDSFWNGSTAPCTRSASGLTGLVWYHNLSAIPATVSLQALQFWQEIGFSGPFHYSNQRKLTFLLESAKWSHGVMARRSQLPLVSLRNIHNQAGMNYYLKSTQVGDPLQSCGFKKTRPPSKLGRNCCWGMDVHELPCLFWMLVEPFVSSLANS